MSDFQDDFKKASDKAESGWRWYIAQIAECPRTTGAILIVMVVLLIYYFFK